MAHEVAHTKLLQVELERNQLKRMVEQYEKERNVVQDFMEKEMISHLKDKYSPFQVVLLPYPMFHIYLSYLLVSFLFTDYIPGFLNITVLQTRRYQQQ